MEQTKLTEKEFPDHLANVANYFQRMLEGKTLFTFQLENAVLICEYES